MELKSDFPIPEMDSIGSSNRTFMELKLLTYTVVAYSFIMF